MTGLFGFLFGVPIRTSDLMVETVQHSRSPSRAKRRARLGHRQHYRTQPMQKAVRAPDGTLIMHPAVLDALLETMKAQFAAATPEAEGWRDV